MKQFWITNISNRNISLSDLNLTINAFTSVNLLDNKHYYYSIEQLEKSANSGSLFKKRNRLTVRKVAPEVIKMNIPFVKETYIPSRQRSIYDIKEEYYEELDLNKNDDIFAEQEKYAAENADMAEIDNQQQVIKKV